MTKHFATAHHDTVKKYVLEYMYHDILQYESYLPLTPIWRHVPTQNFVSIQLEIFFFML